MSPVASLHVVVGNDALTAMHRLRPLHDATSTPITARAEWLSLWARHHPQYQPIAVIAQGSAGRPEAAVLLARRRRFGRWEVVAMGHGASDHVRLPSISAPAARAVARTTASLFAGSPGPWRLRVEQLPVGDTVATSLAAALDHAVLVPGDGSPILRFGDDRSLRSHTSPGWRRSVRTARRRLAGADVRLTVEHTQDVRRISGILPEIERVRRSRDAALGRRSGLEEPSDAEFWRAATLQLGAEGVAEVSVMWIGDDVAAYAIGLLDGRTYRMWDARMSPSFARFTPGRVLYDIVLSRALADERFTELDWMRGEVPYKFGAADGVVPAEHLVAWSSPVVRAALESPRAIRSTLGRATRQHAWLGRAWHALKAADRSS